MLTPESTSRVVWNANRGAISARVTVYGREAHVGVQGFWRSGFYAERGMPAYACGPGLLSISHGPKEFVNTDRMVDCAAV
jgi:acetylornithine deacetylase/succinyl-diaminopimelate desuccinylase-like protein